MHALHVVQQSDLLKEVVWYFAIEDFPCIYVDISGENQVFPNNSYHYSQ